MSFGAKLTLTIFNLKSIFAQMLPSSWLMAWGDFLGFLWIDIFKVRRDVVLDNLKIAFPDWSDEKRLKIARQSLKNIGRSFVEYYLFRRLNKNNLNDFFEFVGAKKIEDKIAKKQGVILLSLHMGSCDYGSGAMTLKGWPIHVIGKRLSIRWLDEVLYAIRSINGTRYFLPRNSLSGITDALAKGESVVFAFDQFTGPPIGVRTKFFGKETGAVKAVAMYALKSGVPVMPLYTWRRPDGIHEIVVEDPIEFQDEGQPDKTIAVMTQKYTDKIEEIIRKHPDQWFWIHRRWKEFRENG